MYTSLRLSFYPSLLISIDVVIKNVIYFTVSKNKNFSGSLIQNKLMMATPTSYHTVQL